MARRKRNRKSGQNNGVQNGIPPAESAHDAVICQVIEMGLQSQRMGNFPQAESLYNKVLAADPNNADAYRLLGTLFHERGDHAQSVVLIKKSMENKPNMASAYCNLADAQRALGHADEAIVNCRKALSLKPNFPQALNNLGNILQDQGDTSGAIFYHKKAISLDRKHEQYRRDLGTALRRENRNEEAISCFRKAIEIKSGNTKAHIELSKTLELQGHDSSEEDAKLLHKAIKNISFEPAPSLPDTQVEASLNAMENTVALITAGRAGSMFFHSLFDNHPEIWTTPGIYFKGYFEGNVWRTLSGVSGPTKNYKVLVEKFCDYYEILFDACSNKPVFGDPILDAQGLGQATGLTTMGEERSHALKLNREAFISNLMRLLSLFKKVDSKIFFKLIHLAYNETLNLPRQKSALFYHFHNPDFTEIIHFLGLFKSARLIEIIREPVQCLESWLYFLHSEEGKQKVYNDFLHGTSLPASFIHDTANQSCLDKYQHSINRIGSIFDEFTFFAFNFAPSMVIRLEDVKKRPNEFMPLIADWIGIKDHESLYTPTFQGQYYWGPKSSLSPKLKGFESSSIDRDIGVLFSERDQFIFKTLLYPARVRFGYQEEDPERHKKDLKKVKPLLDEPLEFEVKLYNLLRGVSTPHRALRQYQNLRLILKAQFSMVSKRSNLPLHLTNQFEVA